MSNRRSIKNKILNTIFDADPKRAHMLFNKTEAVQRTKNYNKAKNYWSQYRGMKDKGRADFKNAIVSGLESAGGTNKNTKKARKTRSRKKKVVKRS